MPGRRVHTARTRPWPPAWSEALESSLPRGETRYMRGTRPAAGREITLFGRCGALAAEPCSPSMAASASPRRHRVLVAVVLALAVITGFFAMFSVWANRQALNTDNWENTSSQLLANKNIQNAVGAYLVNELFTSVDVPAELQKLLPP